jgi:signal transduction histidine kinase
MRPEPGGHRLTRAKGGAIESDGVPNRRPRRKPSTASDWSIGGCDARVPRNTVRTISTAIHHESLLVDEVAGLARAYAEAQAFVSLLAHELRTRLKVTERALSSAGEDGVDAALENTRTVQELVETLLELARGQADGPADSGLAVRRVLHDLRDDVELLETEILAGELPLVRLPQGLLETVLRNLLANALEAGASTIELFGRPDGTICVSDDGPGVPPERAARIFGVYSGSFGGAGLGLTLCREIVRRCGGDLWLELPSTFAFRAAA